MIRNDRQRNCETERKRDRIIELKKQRYTTYSGIEKERERQTLRERQGEIVERQRYEER